MIFCPGLQQTVAGEARLEGIGIHTGKPCQLTISGADAGTGVIFHYQGAKIRACPENVVETRRGTTIGCDGVRVVCVEHVLASLAGCGVDNAECVLTGPELPIMDGSARDFVRAILDARVVPLEKERRETKVRRLCSIAKGDAAALASPSEGLQISYLLRYDHPQIGLQFRSFRPGIDDFGADIAGARTFGKASEGEYLRSQGLALGASTENALILYDDHIEPEVRFADEFVRHKLLDMVGDLSLAGVAMKGTFTGIASGHWANVELARQVKEGVSGDRRSR